jgi:hypothetical protein
MKKKIIIGVVLFIILFVVADYIGLFGIIHADGAVGVPFKFRIIDSKESPARNVSITTFLGNYEVGNRVVYEDEKSSILCGETGVLAGWTKTILFKKPLFMNRRINKQEIRFVFQHPDYLEQEKIFLVKNLRRETHTIVLQDKDEANENSN